VPAFRVDDGLLAAANDGLELVLEDGLMNRLSRADAGRTGGHTDPGGRPQAAHVDRRGHPGGLGLLLTSALPPVHRRRVVAPALPQATA
jgi:hypothetical protein